MVRAFREWFLEQLAMYAAYHKDSRNRLTHYIGVPTILFSIMIVLEQVEIEETTSGAVLLLGLILIVYTVAVPLIGLISATVYVPLYLAAAHVAVIGSYLGWGVAAAAFVAGWAIQFIGHVFEGRRPAFTVNMVQVFMAPAFLVAESLFAIGLQRSLASTLLTRAQKYARS